MNEAVAVAIRDVASLGLDDLMALLGLPSRDKRGELSVSASGILKGMAALIDDLLLRTIAAQTKDEFVTVRNETFMPYARAMTSFSKLARNVIPDPVIERIVDESFSELEHDFREQGMSRFGAVTKEQAMFTIWTLRRTSRLISKIVAYGPIPAADKARDGEIAAAFSFHATWAQFHLGCLLVSIRQDKPIQLDVLPEIVDGLRAAVNAYGYIREGLDLRIPRDEPTMASYEWDQEDQELLESSMREMEGQIIEGCSWSDEEASHLNETARARSAALAGVDRTTGQPAKSSPIFGTHIREGIEIVKDWIENPKPKQ